MKRDEPDFDVAIVGAGPVGLALAGWLAMAWPQRASRIAVFDAKPLEQAVLDARVLALSQATRLRLQTLGFPVQATPIHHIHVSEKGRFGQLRLRAQELGLPALGWTVRYGELVHCLSEAVARLNVQVFRPACVEAFKPSQNSDFESLVLENGLCHTASLRIDAEGGLYGEAAQRDRVVDYRQSALVSEIEIQLEPGLIDTDQTLAFERFTPEGPLALLPLSKNHGRYALVWCFPTIRLEERMAMGDVEFAALLTERFGRRIRVEKIGKRGAFPLGTNWNQQLVQGRRVVIGNAAQILHPVAGQGLNLGLRDAVQLSACLDLDALQDNNRVRAALGTFESSRTVDRRALIGLTDKLVQGFSSSNVMLGLGRQLGLNAMAVSPMLRKQFAELMLFGLSS